MRATYDPAADAAYVYLCEIVPGEAVKQKIIGVGERGEIILDFDRKGRLLGIEILGASLISPEALLAEAKRLC